MVVCVGVIILVFFVIVAVIFICLPHVPLIIKPIQNQMSHDPFQIAHTREKEIKRGMVTYPCSPTMSFVNLSSSSSCATQPVRLSLYE